MRRVVVGLAGKVGPALMVALVVALALAAVVSAQPWAPLAPQIPTAPHQFYGTVFTDKGKPLAAGTAVTARAVNPGAWTGTVTMCWTAVPGEPVLCTVDASRNYGVEAAFLFPGDDTISGIDGAVDGDHIAFYVLGVQAKLYVGASPIPLDWYPFSNFGYTNLNLKVALSYTIKASAGDHGSISPSGDVKVDYGFDQAFTIQPDPDYLIADVVVDEVSQGPITSYTFTNVTAPHTISATFMSKRVAQVYLPWVVR